MTDISAETEQPRQRLTDGYGRTVNLIALAAIGITRHAWRSDWYGYVEDAHTVSAPGRRNRITDGEMFAANVATTRLTIDYLQPYPNVDWPGLAKSLIDPDRVAGQRSLVDLLGKTRHGRWARWVDRFVAALEVMSSKYGAEWVLLSMAVEGTSYADWWAGPRWPRLVEAFIRQLTDEAPGITKEELRTALLNAPDKMSPTIQEWCVTEQLIGYTRL